MQPETEFDGVRDAVVVNALTALILERVDGATRGGEALFEVPGADDAKMLRGDWLAVPLHCFQEHGNAGAVDLVDAEEARQRLMRAADFVEDLALARGPREPAKF